MNQRFAAKVYITYMRVFLAVLACAPLAASAQHNSTGSMPVRQQSTQTVKPMVDENPSAAASRNSQADGSIPVITQQTGALDSAMPAGVSKPAVKSFLVKFSFSSKDRNTIFKTRLWLQSDSKVLDTDGKSIAVAEVNGESSPVVAELDLHPGWSYQKTIRPNWQKLLLKFTIESSRGGVLRVWVDTRSGAKAFFRTIPFSAGPNVTIPVYQFAPSVVSTAGLGQKVASSIWQFFQNGPQVHLPHDEH